MNINAEAENLKFKEARRKEFAQKLLVLDSDSESGAAEVEQF
jgi:hypothetical protein